MQINVEFEKNWTLEEIKEYMLDMQNERYLSMDLDEHLELAACAYFYASEPGIGEKAINTWAKTDLAEALEEYMPFTEICERLIDGYNGEINEITHHEMEGCE